VIELRVRSRFAGVCSLAEVREDEQKRQEGKGRGDTERLLMKGKLRRVFSLLGKGAWRGMPLAVFSR